MASPQSKYARYDKFVPVLTNGNLNVTQFKALPLFLHQLEENSQKAISAGQPVASVLFRADTYYPVADKKYVATTAAGASAPVYASVETYAPEFSVLAGNVNTALVDITDAAQVREATKLAGENPWFKNLLDTLYTQASASYTRTRNTKTASEFINALNLSEASKINSKLFADVKNSSGVSRTTADVQRGMVANTSSPLVPTDDYRTTPYPFKIDKYILTFMLDAAVAAATTTGSPSAFFNSPASFTDEKFFFRKPNEPTKLFRKDANGVVTEVQQDSVAYKEQLQGANCYNLGFVGDGGTNKCEDLVKKCLGGQDVSACKEFMSDKDWWNENSKVDDLLPTVAMKMLKQFGFSIENVVNKEIGLTLKQYQSPTSWIKTLHTDFVPTNKLTTAEVTSIAGNQALMSYLEKVVNKINSNPAVLNSGYTGPSTIPSNNFAGTRLSQFGIKPLRVAPGSAVPSVSSVVGLQSQVLNRRLAVGHFYGVPTLGGLIFQRGGGSVLDNLPMLVAPHLKELFKSFETTLKANGKDLDASDKAHIYSLLEKLGKTEEQLKKAVIYTEKYIELLSVYGESDKSSVLKYDHIQQFVDKRNALFEKVTNRQLTSLDIQKAVAEAVQSELAKKTTP